MLGDDTMCKSDDEVREDSRLILILGCGSRSRSGSGGEIWGNPVWWEYRLACCCWVPSKVWWLPPSCWQPAGNYRFKLATTLLDCIQVGNCHRNMGCSDIFEAWLVGIEAGVLQISV